MDVAKEVWFWLSLANEDREFAGVVRHMGYPDKTAYNCMLAGERVLKALCVYRRRKPAPRFVPGDKLAVALHAPSDICAAAAKLAADEVPSQYPTDMGIPSLLYTDEIAKDREATADFILNWVKAEFARAA